MAGYQDKAPGVYIEEITPAGPIVGVGTSTPAFIGEVVNPPDEGGYQYNVPVKITNWTEYQKIFGDYAPVASPPSTPIYLPYAVRAFFINGGTKLYVVPLEESGSPPDPDLTSALDNLTRVQDVISMVCAPGITDSPNQQLIITHCEITTKNCFAILDAQEASTPAEVLTQRASLTSSKGYAALYYPWIKSTNGTFVPPSGYIAGIYARSDEQRGVHKPPANEIIHGALDLQYLLNDTDQGDLNKTGINALRVFPGGPPVVWGARTTCNETTWQYVNVRRLFIYVEESIKQGIGWATFEPNNYALWKKLERTITEFLDRVWRAGALFGKTAQEAFYVRIDEELNPRAVRDLGELYIEIGMAPVRPAEFIIVRIGMWEGGSQVIEG